MTMIQLHKQPPSHSTFKLNYMHSSLSVARLVFCCWTRPCVFHTERFWDSSGGHLKVSWEPSSQPRQEGPVTHSKGSCNRGSRHSNGGYSHTRLFWPWEGLLLDVQWPSGYAKARVAAHDLSPTTAGNHVHP